MREAARQSAGRGLRGRRRRVTRFGVIRFPGSCDEVDALQACERYGDAEILWHRDRDLKGVDAVVVPGGFSYGDYLRPGAIARFSPVMEAVAEFAAGGRAGARDLQRVPGAVRGGAPARRAARQRPPPLPLPPGGGRRGERRHRRSRARARAKSGSRFPASTRRGATSRRPSCSTGSRPAARSCFAMRRATIRTAR